MVKFVKTKKDKGIKAGRVHLQGWGEPLLHPDLPVMIALARAAGARVSLTTSGMLLDAPMAAALGASGLDIPAFFLAGTGWCRAHAAGTIPEPCPGCARPAGYP